MIHLPTKYSKNLISAVPEITSICQHLFEQSEISSFDFIRLFKDGSCIVVSTKKGLIEFFMEKEYPILPELNTMFKSKHPGEKFSWVESSVYTPNSWQELVYNLRRYFDIDHCLAIMKKYATYLDVFYFYTKPDNQSIIQFYLNNEHFFESFIFYFQDIAKDVIGKLQKHKIFLPEHMLPSDVTALFKQSEKRKSSLISPRKFFLNENQYVTKNELKVIRLLIAGHTIKEAALEIGISPRTVETYLRNAKTRLLLTKTNNLFELILQKNLHQE